MKTTKTFRHRWLHSTSRVLGLAAFSALPGLASAQIAPPGLEADVVIEDQIVVTGTRIPRADQRAASSVTSFDAVTLSRFQQTNVEEFLNTQPQFQPDFSRSTNVPGDGTAALNLRGLGSERTLVLLDGRRMAPLGTGTAVDVNLIPSTLIERIDVVTGGASAVYGSDSVSGAVNFITRRDFEGFELSGQFDIYGAGDGEVYNASVAAGKSFAKARGHVSVFGDFLERRPLLAGERDISSVSLSEDPQTGELSEFGTPVTPDGVIFFPLLPIDGVPSAVVFNPDGTLRAQTRDDQFNFAPDNYLQTPLTRWSFGGFADFALSDDVTLDFEAMYTDTKQGIQFAPVSAATFAGFSISPQFFAPSAIPLLTQGYDADGDGIGQAFILRRIEEAGPRQAVREGESWRAVVGMEADLGRDWALAGHYAYSRSDQDGFFRNDVSRSRLQQSLIIDPVSGGCADPSDGCVPANIFGAGNLSDAALAFIEVPDFKQNDTARQHVATVSATGPVFDLPAGDVVVSAGAEYRRNSAIFEPASIFSTGDTLGFFATSERVEGAIEVVEGFAETLVPVLDDHALADRLELEAGLRYSDYSTIGGATTWKIGGHWEGLGGVRARMLWQRAIRAPNLQETLETPTRTNTLIPGSSDVCLASQRPVERGFGDVCIAQGLSPDVLGIYDVPPGRSLQNYSAPITIIRGGNPDLAEEVANTFTAGLGTTLDVGNGLRLGTDYYRIDLGDAISRASDPIGACNISRDPDDPLCLALTRLPSGFPQTLNVIPLNVSEAVARGIDGYVDLSFDGPDWIGPGTQVSLNVVGTHTLEYGFALSPATPFIDCAGGFSRRCTSTGRSAAYPDWVVNSTLSATTDRYGVSLRWRHLSGVDNLTPDFDALTGFSGRPPLAIPRVGARNYFDISGRLDVSDTLRLRAGIDNVLEAEPPILGNQAVQQNTDTARYDVYGRRLFVKLTARFE